MTTSIPFLALLAPFNRPAADGRELAPGGPWELSGPSAVQVYLPQVGTGLYATNPQPAGWLHRLEVTPHALYGHGTVSDRDLAEAMAAGELRPDPELKLVRPAEPPGAYVARITCGQVNALALGRTPAWPDVWFSVELDGRYRHPPVRFDAEDGEGFARQVAVHGVLLDRVIGSSSRMMFWDEALIRQRLAGEHDCVRCGEPARRALISSGDPVSGRWLDLCPACYDWLREAFPAVEAS